MKTKIAILALAACAGFSAPFNPGDPCPAEVSAQEFFDAGGPCNMLDMVEVQITEFNTTTIRTPDSIFFIWFDLGYSGGHRNVMGFAGGGLFPSDPSLHTQIKFSFRNIMPYVVFDVVAPGQDWSGVYYQHGDGPLVGIPGFHLNPDGDEVSVWLGGSPGGYAWIFRGGFTPIPEPGTATVILIGCAVLASVYRRFH